MKKCLKKGEKSLFFYLCHRVCLKGIFRSHVYVALGPDHGPVSSSSTCQSGLQFETGAPYGVTRNASQFEQKLKCYIC